MLIYQPTTDPDEEEEEEEEEGLEQDLDNALFGDDDPDEDEGE